MKKNVENEAYVAPEISVYKVSAQPIMASDQIDPIGGGEEGEE